MDRPYTYDAKLIDVVDGDTLDLDFDLGMNLHVHTRVRLYGVDTPETFGVKKDSEEYKKGKEAAAFVCMVLGDLADHPRLVVQTRKDKKGKYGRYLAEVLVQVSEQWISLNDLLVEEGHAKPIE